MNPVRVPSVADTSADVKPVTDSLAVKVTIVVEPDDTDVGFAVMVTAGAFVSYVMVVAIEAVLLLPGGSVNLLAVTDIEPVPVCVSAVGVKTAV